MSHTPPPGKQEPEVTRKLVAILERLPDLRERFFALRGGPEPGSEAAADSARPLGEWPWVLGSGAWVTGSDHALSWQLLLDSGTVPMAGHLTLCRGALEGAAICRYLVEPGITSDERIQRGASVWHEDLRQRLNFEKAIGIDQKPRTPPAKTAAERQAEFRAAMTKHGLDIHAKPKTTTELFGLYLKGAVRGNAEWAYRFLSAFAHGRSLMLTMSERGQIDETSVAGVKQVLVTADSRYTLLATQLAVEGLAFALGDLESYVKAPRP